jgi:hypothetical protein
LPLKEWKEAGKDGQMQMGRVKDEKIWPLSSMTMYSKVSFRFFLESFRTILKDD